MNYFRFFPTTNYTLTEGNTKFTLALTQLTAHAKIMEKLAQNLSVIYDYVVEGEERPDNVSERLYGGPQFTWVILMLNNITSLFDWPLTGNEFNDYILTKYGTTANAQSQSVYHMSSGIIVDHVTYTNLPNADKGEITTQYDTELELNEKKRRIKVVPSAFIPQLQKELTKLFQ